MKADDVPVFTRRVVAELRGRRHHTLVRWWWAINNKTLPRNFPIAFDFASSEDSILVMGLIEKELGKRVVSGRIITIHG